MKSYHLAMVPDKKGGLGTLVKVGLALAGAYYAYTKLTETDEEKAEKKESGTVGTDEIKKGIDTAAKEASDFAAKVLKAAKKIPDAISK